MPRLSRARRIRILKWTGVVLSVLVAIVWMASLWLELIFLAPHVIIGTWNDTVLVEVTSDYGKRETELVIRSHEFEGLALDAPRIRFKGSLTDWFEVLVNVPMWLLLLVTAGPTAWLWHRFRPPRFPPGHWQRCGYDLTGNTSGVCSECGETATPVSSSVNAQLQHNKTD